MAIQNNVASSYLSAFDSPIGVSIMSKLTQWPFLQQLGFNGSLSSNNLTFHGLGDFNTEMASYSASNGILTTAWNVIKSIVPKNPKVLSQMFISPVLGQVGNLFQTLPSFGLAFAVTPSQLKSPAAINSAVQTAASIPATLPTTIVSASN